jgi:7,8-dihydropterin-6-yl-methyl-4-(beta-D-ribofuranosyl)aminobenzene 5'-phosphate synthase
VTTEARPAGGVKITILVDDRAGGGGLAAEHGLSLWIETEDGRILFDTGQGEALDHNAGVLGADLAKTDALVLSHGHYDHTGGIPSVLRRTRNVHVYCHPGIVLPRYGAGDGTGRPIHMPGEAMEALDRIPPERLHWVQQPVLLAEGIGVTGPIPRETDFEETGGPFYLDPRGNREDPMEDDLALWVRTGDGLIVCVGCAHAGLINTLDHVRRLNGGLGVRAVIGGFHLLCAGRERLERTADALRTLEPDALVPCHCTGGPAVDLFRKALGGRVSPGAAGRTFSFPAV